jgi:hypothetical protein
MLYCYPSNTVYLCIYLGLIIFTQYCFVVFDLEAFTSLSDRCLRSDCKGYYFLFQF